MGSSRKAGMILAMEDTLRPLSPKVHFRTLVLSDLHLGTKDAQARELLEVLRGSLATQRSGSPDVPGSTINQPIVGSVGVTSGLTQRLGRTEGSLSFLIDRRFYGDAETSTGVTRLSADNYNAYGARVRLAHELTPGVKPFLRPPIA